MQAYKVGIHILTINLLNIDQFKANLMHRKVSKGPSWIYFGQFLSISTFNFGNPCKSNTMVILNHDQKDTQPAAFTEAVKLSALQIKKLEQKITILDLGLIDIEAEFKAADHRHYQTIKNLHDKEICIEQERNGEFTSFDSSLQR